MTQNAIQSSAPASGTAARQGYTIDELRYQIALATLRKEFCREQLADTCNSLISVAPWNRKQSSAASAASTLTDAVFRGFKYSDYLLLGYSVFKTAKSIFSFFKRKKKH